MRATKAHGRHLVLRMSQLGKQADLQHPWLPQHPLLLGLVHHLCHCQCAQPNHASCGTRPPAQHANRCPHTTCSYFLRQALGTQVLTAKNLTESCKHGAISLLRRMFNMQFSRAAKGNCLGSCHLWLHTYIQYCSCTRSLDLQTDKLQSQIDFVNAFEKVCFCHRQILSNATCKMQNAKWNAVANRKFSDVLIFTNYLLAFCAEISKSE